MIYITKYDVGGKDYFDLQLTLANKTELEALKVILKRTHHTEVINFVYTSNPEGLPKSK